MPRALQVYVIHFDAPEWCAETVRSLLDSDGLEVQVFVVHNGGARPELPAEVRVLHPPGNIGYAGGANFALEHWLTTFDGGDWVALASHDVVVPADGLARLLATGMSDPATGIVAPTLRDTSLVVHDEGWVSGTLMLLRRRCIIEVGRFDERFWSYYEDKDYGLRATGRGWRVVIDGAVRASHHGSSSPMAQAWTDANRLLHRALREAPVRGRARLLFATATSALRSLTGSSAGRKYLAARGRALVASFRRGSLAWRAVARPGGTG